MLIMTHTDHTNFAACIHIVMLPFPQSCCLLLCLSLCVIIFYKPFGDSTHHFLFQPLSLQSMVDVLGISTYPHSLSFLIPVLAIGIFYVA